MSTATDTFTRKTIPAGHYAITWPGNGKVYFFRVTVGKPGSKWAGVRFIQRQASDDYYPVKPEGRTAAWDLILADVPAARALYGDKIGRCSRCNKTLTDDLSRSYGVGPDCRKEWGIA